MATVSPEEVRAYLSGLALASQFEIEELRKAPVDLKLRQTWALMTSADLFEDEARREAEVRQVRDRWDRLYQALHG